MRAYSACYETALALAAQAHCTQMRKGGDVPYIVHPVHVSTILIRYGCSEDEIVAGLLHDVVEDQDVSLQRIETEFGPSVAEIVAALTEQKNAAGVKRPWEDRKQELLDQVRQASIPAVTVKAADTLHSAHSLTSDLGREGAAVWRNFSRGPEPTLWYYREVGAIVRQRLGHHPLADELDEAIQHLEQAIAVTGTK